MPSSPSERHTKGDVCQNAIARLAVSYIKESQTVFIGGLAIHCVMMKSLPKHIRFTVVTNSMEVACYLRNVENVQPYAVGGNVKSSGDITDSLANEFVKQFTVDACFANATGLSTKGLSTATPEVPSSTKPIMTMQRKITLIEYSKFGVDLLSNM